MTSLTGLITTVVHIEVYDAFVRVHTGNTPVYIYITWVSGQYVDIQKI